PIAPVKTAVHGGVSLPVRMTPGSTVPALSFATTFVPAKAFTPEKLAVVLFSVTVMVVMRVPSVAEGDDRARLDGGLPGDSHAFLRDLVVLIDSLGCIAGSSNRYGPDLSKGPAVVNEGGQIHRGPGGHELIGRRGQGRGAGVLGDHILDRDGSHGGALREAVGDRLEAVGACGQIRALRVRRAALGGEGAGDRGH